jgi:hypothetical protein
MTTLHEVPAIIKRAVRTGTNVHLTGDPAIGKTQMIEATVAEIQEKEPGFNMWTLYTPSLSPLDFTAVVPNKDTGTLQSYHNDRLPNRFVDPDMRGVIFLGERDNADPATNKALQKYINNEDMGGLQKPAGVVVISDSNSMSHRSGVMQQSLALLSRSRCIEVTCSPSEFLKYLIEIEANVFVQAYLSIRKEHVNTFDTVIKNSIYGAWASPRSWERVSWAMTDADKHKEVVSLDEYIGDLGEAVGREFFAFLVVAKELISYEDIINDPKTASMPEKASDTYAVIAMLAASVTDKEFSKVRTYVERFGMELQILFLRLLASNSQSSRVVDCSRTATYRDWFKNEEMTKAICA